MLTAAVRIVWKKNSENLSTTSLATSTGFTDTTTYSDTASTELFPDLSTADLILTKLTLF